jgi:uncharacterized protein with PIN domain
MRFVADCMLGKLAKWLRVMGYDTHYQSYYRQEVLDQLIGDGRYLLSRNYATVRRHRNALLVHGDRVADQMAELKTRLDLTPDPSIRFSRCLICNVELEAALPDEAKNRIPEYVFYGNTTKIRLCPCCGRYYWPGSHRERMLKQLHLWGFVN